MFRYAAYNKETGAILWTGIAGSPQRAMKKETDTIGIMPCEHGVKDTTHEVELKDHKRIRKKKGQ